MSKTLLTVAVMATVGLVAYAVLGRGGSSGPATAASSSSSGGEWWQPLASAWLSPETWGVGSDDYMA